MIDRPGKDRLGEGPLWSQRLHAFFWVDILGRKLNRLSLPGEQFTSWDIPEMIGWIIERREKDGFIAGLHSGFAELHIDPLVILPLADPEPGKPGNRMNDAKADSAGRIWAGTMPVDADKPEGAFYRLDPDGKITCVDAGYTIANGPALSPDERFLYHTDSRLGLVYRFALSSEGVLGERKLFIDFRSAWGTPDGMTVDSDGGLWIAHWGTGRISRFHDDGTMDHSIALPASQITSCAFVGDDLSRMFVTSAADGVDEPLAGSLFEVETGRHGLPAATFGG